MHGLAWFKLAEMAFKDGALDEAEEAYQRAGQAPPGTPLAVPGVSSRHVVPLTAYAQFGLARIAIEHGRTAQSMSTLDVILAPPDIGAGVLPPREDHHPGRGPIDRARVRAALDPALEAIVARSTMRDLLLKHAALAARGGDLGTGARTLVRRAAGSTRTTPMCS